MMKLFKEIYVKYLKDVAERENITVTETKLNEIFESHGSKSFELIIEDLMESWLGLSIDEIKEDLISLFNQGTFIDYQDAVKYLGKK